MSHPPMCLAAAPLPSAPLPSAPRKEEKTESRDRVTPDIAADFSSVIMQRSERDMQKGRTAQLEPGKKDG